MPTRFAKDGEKMAGFGAKVKLSVDRSTAAKQEFNDQINGLVKQIKISNKFVVLQKDMDRVRNSAQTMLNKSPIKINNIDCTQAVTKLRKDLQNVINSLSIKNGVSITGLVDPTGAGTIATKIDDIADAAARGQNEVNRFNAQMNVLKTTMSSLASAYKTILPGGKNAITDATQLDAITQRYTALQQKIEEIKNAKSIASQEELAALQQEAIAIQTLIAKINEERIAHEKTAASAKQAEADKQAAAKAAASAQEEYRTQLDKVNNLLVQTKKNLDSWGASKIGKTSDEYAKIQEYVAELEALRTRLVLTGKATDDFGDKFGGLKTKIGTASAIIKEAGENTQTFTDRVGGLASKFTSWLTVSQVIMQVYRALKEMVNVVAEVDAAMTELRKVTDETEASYSKFLDTAAVRAKAIGATISDTVNATADFARLGHSIADASVLADAAIIYKNVGDGIENINQASESIISTMQAFGVEAANVMTIVDKFNIIGNKFAISSTGIGEALLNSASALAAAGNTLDESIALITAANEVIQNPEKVGTAMKTMSMYIRAAKTEAEEAGIATDGMANSVSELREEILALTGNKVDIMLDENTFKSTVQIMRELSTVWDDLTDISRTNVTELIGGGVRNANVISALINNFETVEEVLVTAADSAGSALAENEKYLDSIAGKVSTFKATFEELSVTLIDSEFVKQIVDFGTGLLNVLNAVAKVIESIGGLNTVLTGTVGIIAAIKLDSLIKLISVTLPAAFMKLIKPLTTVITAISRAPIVFKSFKSGTALAIPGTSKFSTALKALGISASTAQIAIGALTIAITAAIAIYQHHQQVLAEQRDAAIDAANALDETSISVEEYKDKIIELRAAIDSGNLSEKEAYDKRQELITIQESLIEMFGKEAEGIDLVTGSIYGQIDAINSLSEANWNNYQKENIAAIRDAIDLYTDFDPSKLDFWNSPIGGGFTIEVPSSGELWDAIEDLDLDIVPADFNKRLEEELLAADIGVEIPIAGVSGDFVTDLNISSIYEARDVYQELYDITEKLGKEFFGNDYLDYVGSALEGYSKQIGAINAEIEESEIVFDTYVEGLLNYEAEYSAVWGKILAAQKEYNQAVLNGDDVGAANALAKMQEAEDAFLSSGWDNEAVNLYVSEFFDEWNNAAKTHEFEIEVSAKLSDDNDELGNSIKSAIKAFEDEAGKIDMYRILNVGADWEASGSPTENISAEEQAFITLKNAAESYGVEIEDLCSLLMELGYIQGEAVNPDPILSSLEGLKTTITDLSSAYDLLEKAQSEMASEGGLSVDTVNSLIASNSEYIDYLYEENGVVKLNTDAWKANANAKALAEMANIRSDIHTIEEENRLLEDKNDALRESIAYYEQQRSIGNDGGLWNRLIIDATNEIEANNDAIADNTELIIENQSKLAIYGSLYGSITGDMSAYTEALENFANVANVIDSVATSYAGLANLQNAVAEGFTFSLDKILEYAKAYPEILNSATVTANGELALNEAVVNSFIAGKKAELDAQIDSEIAKLEADKAVLEAKKENATAQLELAKSLAEGETELTREEITYKLNAGNALAEALINMEVDKATAYKLATAAMAENEEEFTRIAMECFQNMDENSAKAAYNMAHAIYVNAQRSSWSIAEIAQQAHETAKAIRGMANGYIEGADYSLFNGGSGVYVGSYDYSAADGNFVGTEYNYEAKQISLDEYIADLELDISDYENAIEQINGQIATLEALRNTPFESFKNLVDNASSIVGEKTNDKIEQEKKEAEKAAKEEEEKAKLVEEYIAAIDEYYMALKRLEEVQKRRVSLEKKLEHTEDLSEKIFLSSGLIDVYKEEADAEKNLMLAKQATIAANVGALRGLGFQVDYDASTNELYIKNLEHLNELTANSVGEYETLQEATNALRKETEDLIDTTEQLNQDNIDAAENIEDLGYEILDTKNAIIDYIEEIYDKQVESYQKIIDLRKELIESAKEELDYEDEIAEKVKEVAELQARIDQLALDDSRSAQAERAALMEELAEKQKDLADTQSDHSTDAQIEALDKMAEDYETQRTDEIATLRATVTESEELWNAFYQTILGNNVTVGNSIDDNIANAWIRAAQAVNDYSAAMSGISSGGVVINAIPKYHTGGVVDEVNVGKDEALALLEKGEVVLNDGKQQTLYKIIDFQQELSNRLGALIGSLTLPDITGGIRSLISDAANNISTSSQSMVFEPHIQVEINHSGNMNNSDAKSYGEQIANTAIEKLYGAFERRGISSTRAARLKP